METIHIAYTLLFTKRKELFTKRKDFFAIIFDSGYFDENTFPFNRFGKKNADDSKARES